MWADEKVDDSDSGMHAVRRRACVGRRKSTLYEIGETGLSLCVPSGWTQKGETPAQLAFATEDGTGKLLVHLSHFPQWTFEEFEAALIKASAENSLTEIEKITLEGRMWLTHRLGLEAARSHFAITEIGEGCLLTLEFRSFGETQPEDVFGDALNEILLSIAEKP